MIQKDRVTQPREGFKMGTTVLHTESYPLPQIARGEFFLEMRDAHTGDLLEKFHRKNIITLDAGILAARLFKDPAEPAYGAFMLAVGTGAAGSPLAPNAPDSRQRKLNAEIARKPFSSTVFRDSLGNAVAIPTNIVDFTASFGEGEAVGPLTEMGIVSPLSNNPLVTNPNPDVFPARDTALDLTLYDTLINYLTFGVVTKPSTAVLTITWRLIF